MGADRFARRTGFGTGQPKGRTAVLMPGEPVPQAHDKYADQFIRSVDRVEFRQLTAP